jgi:hypothetical protein
MTFDKRLVGIVFEGIGSDTAESGGILWYYGNPQNVPATSTYEWVNALVEVPSTITDSVDVWTGQVKTSPINIAVANVDLAARSLLYQQAKTPHYMVAALAAAATSLTISATTLAGTVIFVNDEAILLGTHSGGGTYTGCTRGYWSTIDAPHEVNTYVYTKNPYLRYRAYKLIVHDVLAGTTSTIQRGYINRIATNAEGTVIQIGCQELLSLLSGATINRGSPKSRITGTVDAQGILSPQLDTTLNVESRVWRDDSSAKSYWLQTGGTVVNGSILNGVFSPLATGPVVFRDAPDIEYDARSESERYSPFGDDGLELFVVVRSLLSGATALTSTAGLGTTNAFNAIAIAYAFLRSGFGSSDSGFDQWRGNWGVGLPGDYFDDAAIQAVIDGAADDKVDQMLLGWDGEPVTVEDLVCEKLLRPHGKFLANKMNGDITIGWIRILDIEEFADAPTLTALPKTLQWEVDLNGAFSAVIAEVGESPFSDPDRIVVESRSGSSQDSSRRALYDTRRELVYDYSTMYSGGSNLAIRATLMSRLMQGIQAVPKITIDVVEPASGVEYNLGEWYKVSVPDITAYANGALDAWWVDATATRIPFSTSAAQFTGLLTGRRHNIKNGSYTLTLLMLAYRDNAFIRWRAPSAVVASNFVIGDGTYLVTTDANTFHASDYDAEKFSAGDIVDLFYGDGERVDGGAANVTTVISVSAAVIVITATPDVPTDGMIIRLAAFNLYGDGGEPVPGAGRAYVFAADGATDTIYSTDAADIYG